MKKVTKMILNPTVTQVEDMINKGFNLTKTDRDNDAVLYEFELVSDDNKEEIAVKNTNGCEGCPLMNRKYLVNPKPEDVKRFYDCGYTVEKIETLENGDLQWVLVRWDEDNEENCGIQKVTIHYFDGTVDTIDHIENADFDVDEGMLIVYGNFHCFGE